MIDYFALILIVVVFGNVLSYLGYNPIWLILPIIFLTLPTVYTTFSGSLYLPTDRSTQQKMIDLADILPREIVIDLGCGDGRLLRAAARLGAVTIGYEISFYMYWIAKWYRSGEIRYQNFWTVDINQADVNFYFIEPRAMARFEMEKWHTLKPGCRVIAHAFPFPNLQPTASDRHVYRYDTEMEPPILKKTDASENHEDQ